MAQGKAQRFLAFLALPMIPCEAPDCETDICTRAEISVAFLCVCAYSFYGHSSHFVSELSVRK